MSVRTEPNCMISKASRTKSHGQPGVNAKLAEGQNKQKPRQQLDNSINFPVVVINLRGSGYPQEQKSMVLFRRLD